MSDKNGNDGDCDWLDGSHDGEICKRFSDWICDKMWREGKDTGCHNRRKGEKDRRGEQPSQVWLVDKEWLNYPPHDRRKSTGRREDD